jgi:hypothetical protein
LDERSRKEHLNGRNQNWQTDKSQPKQYDLLQNPSQKGMDGLKALSAIHGILGPIFYVTDKTNIIADCLENHTT